MIACALTTQKTDRESEAEIFQTVVKELSVALTTGSVAILPTPASDCSPVSEPAFQICYVAATQQARDYKPKRSHSGNRKSLSLKLAEVITLKDLQQLQSQKPQSAWSVHDDQGDVLVDCYATVV